MSEILAIVSTTVLAFIVQQACLACLNKVKNKRKNKAKKENKKGKGIKNAKG